MKKIFSAILLIYYFIISTGIAISLHYCMNSIDSVKLGVVESEVCGKCGMHTDDANGCCHDDVKFVKLQGDQQTASFNAQFVTPELQQNDFPGYIAESIFTLENCFSTQNHSPPISGFDICIKNSVFRI